MLDLFCLEMAGALCELQAQLQDGELLLAYLDDVYTVTSPERARAAYDIVTGTMCDRLGIEVNLRKILCWNHA